MPTVKATLNIVFQVIETLSSSVPLVNANLNKITHDGLNLSAVMPGTVTWAPNGATTYTGVAITATDVVPAQLALVSGALTIDLTALTGADGRAVNASGKTIQAIMLRNNPNNANPMIIAKGATNGYSPITGDAFSLPLPAGAAATLYLNNGAALVDSTHKTLDITGTGTQLLDVMILVG